MTVVALKPQAVPAAEPRKRVRTKITFQKERFVDIVPELGQLIKLHDKELWPHREWGPLSLDIAGYINQENAGILHVLTARTGGGRLVGYCFEIVLRGSMHYSRTSHALNDTIYLHPDYRIGARALGDWRKMPGFRLLQARERMLDDLGVERRRMDPKMWHDFGPLLRRLGYEPEAVIYQRIVTQD